MRKLWNWINTKHDTAFEAYIIKYAKNTADIERLTREWERKSLKR